MAHIGLNAILIFFIGLHIRALHVYGSSSPISSLGSGNIVFFPYVPLKDVFMIYTYTSIILVTLYTNPNFFSHPENFIPANPMVTPDHIVPEWYFLPFYAILRSIPDKELGLIAMLGSIVI
jgi:ubiquinol-cytochrome c reductase cytochrome b subunit